MNEYKSQIALELPNSPIDEDRLQRLSMISFAFQRNTFDDLETPAWVLIINYCALDLLGSERGMRKTVHFEGGLVILVLAVLGFSCEFEYRLSL